jgi:hypothetical protein
MTEFDYKFGTKNNWRRTVWKELSQRTESRSAIILYLAGQQDLDRSVAINNGFKPDNMIIIERNKQTAEALRDQGKVVIEADIIDVINSWGKQKIDIVFGDFCVGFEPDVLALLDALDWPEFIDCAMLINLQRGRDPRSNEFRKMIGDRKFFRYNNTGQLLEILSGKHRGLQVVLSDSIEALSVVAIGESIYNADGTVSLMDYNSLTPSGKKLVGTLMEGLKPKYFSYRSSSGLTFDSVIVTSRLKESPLREITKWCNPPLRKKWFSENIAAKIRAALAVRSMRANGKLSHQPWR